MQGIVFIENNQYHYKFDKSTFELTIYGYSGSFNGISGLTNDDTFLYKDVINANSYENKFPIIKFFVKRINTKYLDHIVIDVLYYIETNSDDEKVDAISFAGDELNYFYDINKAFESNGFSDDGEIEIRVKKFNEVNKIYNFDNDDIYKNISLNFYRKLRYGKTEILSVFTSLNLEFYASQNYKAIYEHYILIYNFFRFVNYRSNIRFSSLDLKVKISNDLYKNVGTLNIFYDNKNFFIENEKTIKNRQIKSDYLGDRIPVIIQLIKSKSLYMKHFPESSADMRQITSARFLLVTAAFEWECNEVYGNYKYKENKEFREVTDLIYSILEEEKKKFKGKRKNYFNTYQKSFKYTGVSLMEKLQYVLKDNDEILSTFIKGLFKLNNISDKEQSYKRIAERIGIQRNNFAHGQIDKEFNELVVIDFIILEWLLYSMRLKSLKFEVPIIKIMINELFGRNYNL